MIVLIDNYDSFAFNLVHYLGGLGAEVVVHRNDKVSTADVIEADPEAIVISPGPWRPVSSREHRFRARPSDPAEFPRHRCRVECGPRSTRAGARRALIAGRSWTNSRPSSRRSPPARCSRARSLRTPSIA